MNKYEKIAVFRLLDQNPDFLKNLGLRSRSHKIIVSYATSKDHTAIRHAVPGLKEDTYFVFVTQGKNPHTLRALQEKYPEFHTEKLDAIVAVYENPLDLTEIPAENFADKGFVKACKSSIRFKITEAEEEERKERGVLSKGFYGWKKAIENLVSETLAFKEMELQSGDREVSATAKQIVTNK